MPENGKPLSMFSEFIDLLLRLHHLMQQGLGDSDAAEELRDQMDSPWYALTPSEKELAEGLSEDLYSIGQALHKPVRPPSIPDEQRFKTAMHRGDWARALNVIRQAKENLPSDDVALLRAHCWAHLGEPVVAVEFFADLQRLRSLKPTEVIFMATCMLQAGHTAGALEIIQQALIESDDVMLQLKAVEILSVAADEASGHIQIQLRQQSIHIAENALQCAEHVLPKPDDEELFTIVRISAFMNLAINHLELGQVERAKAVCEALLAIDPDNKNAFFLLGWINHSEASGTHHKFSQQFHREILAIPPSVTKAAVA